MGRVKGNFGSVANFELKLASPFDARLVVDTKSDLVSASTWPSDGDTLYVYQGMIVSVADEGRAYMLVDPSKVTSSDYSGWKAVGGEEEKEVVRLNFSGLLNVDFNTTTDYTLAEDNQHPSYSDKSTIYFLYASYAPVTKCFVHRIEGLTDYSTRFTLFANCGETPAYAYEEGVVKIFTDQNGNQYTWNDDGTDLVEYSDYATEKYVDDKINDVAHNYMSNIADGSLAMPSAVGGIAKGTTLSSLKGQSVSKILDDLLFPTINPTFTAPSASLALASYNAVQEVGAAAPTTEEPDNFTESFNRGAILLNGVNQGYRSGSLKEGYIYFGTDEGESEVLPDSVALGANNYYYKATYRRGTQPKNNKGEDYDSPLAEGSVTSAACVVYGTYPWYASTSQATSSTPVVKQALIKWNATAGTMKSGIFELQPSGTLPQVFKLPRAISKLEQYSDLSSKSDKMEAITWSNDFTESTEQISINGEERTYYVYTYKGSSRGATKLRVTF